ASAFLRRLLPFLRRETRRWAFVSVFSPLRECRGFSVTPPSAVTRNTFSPTSLFRLLSSRWQRLNGHLSTGQGHTYQPSGSLASVMVLTVRSFHRAGPAHGDAADLGQDEIPVIEPGAVAILHVGAGVIAVPSLKAWKSGLFTGLQPTEECLIGSVEAGQHVLQDVAVDGRVRWHLRPQVLQLHFLLIA